MRTLLSSMFRTVSVVCVLASCVGLLTPDTAHAQRGSSRGRQMYNSAMRQRNELLSKQFEQARKIEAERQAVLAAEAAKKLEARKAAANTARQKKDEAHDKAKARMEKERATKPAAKPADKPTAGTKSTAESKTPSGAAATDKPTGDKSAEASPPKTPVPPTTKPASN